MVWAPSVKPPPGAFARQRDFPRSVMLVSQAKFVCATQLRPPPPVIAVSIVLPSRNKKERWVTGVEHLQALPPGTHRPAPASLLHASCFRLVLGTQQVPLAVGRLPFWRATSAVSWGRAAARAARLSMTVVRLKCILMSRLCERWKK